MPSNHQHQVTIKGWTQTDLLEKASRIGEHTRLAAEHILSSSIYPEQNFKSCYGMLMLQRRYDAQRLEAACKRALMGARINYTMIQNILQRGMDKQESLPIPEVLPQHDNLRGADHYK